jgi:uncharacterized membrane protein YbhN (UPF0104 family)
VPARTAGGGWARALLIALKIAVSVFLLWFLLHTYDFSEVAGRLRSIAPEYFALVIVLELFAVGFATWRWMIILHVVDVFIKFRAALPIVYIGLFFNQVLPSNLGGDVVRVWRIFLHGAPVGRAVGSVMLDRAMALVGLALVVLATLPFVFSFTGDRLALQGLAGLVLLIFGGFGVLLAIDKVLSPLARFVPEKLWQSLLVLAQDSRLLCSAPRTGLPAVALGAANQILMAVMVFVLAVGMGIEVSLIACLALVPPVVLASMLPISMAGWGVREGAMVAALGFAGVPAGDALALSVLFGISIFLVSFPGGIIWFVTGDRRKN